MSPSGKALTRYLPCHHLLMDQADCASKAFKSGVSLEQLLSAYPWKSHNTFTQFYLKDLARADSELFYLGPCDMLPSGGLFLLLLNSWLSQSGLVKGGGHCRRPGQLATFLKNHFYTIFGSHLEFLRKTHLSQKRCEIE